MLQTLLRLPAFLYQQRIKGFDPPGDEPFMDPEGIERFKHELSFCNHYLEFGSGGTTVQADRLRIPTISVESDRFYARAVASRLSSGRVTQVMVDLGITGEWGTPFFTSPRKGWRYVSAPFGEHFPDFILVDGRYRAACALESARRAYKAGKAVLMLDDYAHRSCYHVVETWLGRPEMAGRAAIFQIGLAPVPVDAVESLLADKR